MYNCTVIENAAINFTNKEFLDEVLGNFKNFEYKLFGKRELKFYKGEPAEFEFDLNLGMIHFTEQDFKGISAFLEKINKKYGTKITFCIYPAKEANRDIIINVRMPGAPFTID